MGLLHSLAFPKQDEKDKPKPLIIDVEEVLKEAAWDMYIHSYGPWVLNCQTGISLSLSVSLYVCVCVEQIRRLPIKNTGHYKITLKKRNRQCPRKQQLTYELH